MQTQTAIDILQGMIVSKQKEIEALEMAKSAIEGTLQTQLHELETVKYELITTKADLQNALSVPVMEVPVL